MKDAYFYEFELTNCMIVVNKDDEFMLVNQYIPLVYRWDYLNQINTIYDEKEYEQNDVLILKKIAYLFVSVGSESEPENFNQLV